MIGTVGTAGAVLLDFTGNAQRTIHTDKGLNVEVVSHVEGILRNDGNLQIHQSALYLSVLCVTRLAALLAV